MEFDFFDSFMLVAAGFVLRRGADGAVVARGYIEIAVETRAVCNNHIVSADVPFLIQGR